MKLLNTLHCLNVRKSLRVAYFGGSITEGGAEHGWRGKTTAWLKTTWPEAEITEIMAAIGGTGSELGVYRCDTDVIAHEPDLTFIEYAVNDYNIDPEIVSKNIEGIVRKLRRANPMMDIVFAYTVTKRICDQMNEGIPYASRNADEEIASYYNIPSVDIGTPLAEAVQAAGGDWLKYTGDTVHPGPEGYAFCAEASIAALRGWLNADAPASLAAHPMPIPLNSGVPEEAHLFDLSFLCPLGAQPDTHVEHEWKKLCLTLCSRWPRTIGSNKPGSELTIRFRGTAVGLYFMIASDSGMFDWKIDEGEWQSANTFDHYALNFARAGFCIFSRSLPEGNHTLTLRVSAKKDEQSTGHWIRLGAVGLCGELL